MVTGSCMSQPTLEGHRGFISEREVPRKDLIGQARGKYPRTMASSWSILIGQLGQDKKSSGWGC